MSLFEHRKRDFPRELISSGLVTVGRHIKGYKVLYFRTHLLSRTGLTNLHLNELVVKWTLFLISNFESTTDGMGLVFDFSEASALQLSDTSTVIKIITAVAAYMPLGIRFIWLVDAPWLHRPFLNAIFVREKENNILNLVTRDDVLDHLGDDYTPKFLGGLAEVQSVSEVPLSETSLERRSSTLIIV